MSSGSEATASTVPVELGEFRIEPAPPRHPHPPHPERWSASDFVFRVEDGHLVATPAARWLDCDRCINQGRWLYEFNDEGYEVTRPCRCLRPHKVAERITRVCLPEAAQGRTLNTLDWSRATALDGRPLRQRLWSWLNGWEPNARGLILYGPTGVGKTHIAYGIAFWVAANRRARVRYVEWGAYFGAFVEATKSRDGGAERLFEHICSVDLLVLDELNECKGWAQSHLEKVINTRIEARRLTTVITTNLIPGGAKDEALSLAAVFGDRVDSRLAALEAVPLGGADFRRGQG